MAMESGVKSRYSKLPLKDIALRRVATLLCSQPNVYMFVSRMKNRRILNHERAFDSVSKEILAELSLPAPMKEKLASLMKSLLRWLSFHDKFLCSNNTNLCDIDVLKHICWERYEGEIVNYRRTAEALIRHEKLDIDQRYRLACLYCLEPYVRDLWSKLPVRSEESLFNPSPLNAQQSLIVDIWTCIVRGRVNEVRTFLRHSHSSFYHYAFEYAAMQGYKTATQYFFEKLTSEEKEEFLVRTARDVAGKRFFDGCTYLHEYQQYSDVFCYLLTQMTTGQAMDVLKSQSHETLKCILDCPEEEAFLEVAALAFPYLSEDQYGQLLLILAVNNSKLFRKFYLISPEQFKDYTLTKCGFFLREFFRSGDVETIKFIFKNLEAVEKVKLALSIIGMRICLDLVKQGKRHFLELLFREVKLTKEDKERFMVSFTSSHSDQLSKSGKWLWFIQLINEIDADISKSQSTV